MRFKRFNKNGQEEMVGFVFIIILVAIIFLVFIGIFIRQDNKTIVKDSREVVQFLESFEKYTTSCAIGFEPDFSDIGRLIGDCYDKKTCVSGNSACEVLNLESSNILNESFSIGPENYYKGYEIDSFYEFEEKRENILNRVAGNCSGSFIGGETIRAGFKGVFVTNLKICF